MVNKLIKQQTDNFTHIQKVIRQLILQFWRKYIKQTLKAILTLKFIIPQLRLNLVFFLISFAYKLIVIHVYFLIFQIKLEKRRDKGGVAVVRPKAEFQRKAKPRASPQFETSSTVVGVLTSYTSIIIQSRVNDGKDKKNLELVFP